MIMVDQWGTPANMFKKLDKEFQFTLDPCGRHDRRLKNDLCTVDLQKGGDGLSFSWEHHNVFCNPPYSGYQIKDWVKKAFSERNRAEVIVMLIPVRTDRAYFHDYILKHAEVRFLKSRIHFEPLEGQRRGCPAFPSMIVIWRRGVEYSTGLTCLSDFIIPRDKEKND